MSELVKWILIPALGGIGVVLRVVVDQQVTVRLNRDFPYGILLINVLGTFALGLLHGLGAADLQWTLIGTGLLGSFTTFSTWVLDTQRLGERGQYNLAYANVIVSVLAGLAAVWLGHTLGQLL